MNHSEKIEKLYVTNYKKYVDMLIQQSIANKEQQLKILQQQEMINAKNRQLFTEHNEDEDMQYILKSSNR